MPKLLVTADSSKNKMLLVGDMVKKLAGEKGVALEYVWKPLNDVTEADLGVDLIVLFGTSQKLNTAVPIVQGVPFLTRIGMDKAIDDIIAKLKG